MAGRIGSSIQGKRRARTGGSPPRCIAPENRRSPNFPSTSRNTPSRLPALEENTPILMIPASPRPNDPASCAARWTCPRALRARVTKLRPASVSNTPVGYRTNSATPISSSNPRIQRLIADSLSLSLLAARRKLPLSAAATTQRRCRSSMASASFPVSPFMHLHPACDDVRRAEKGVISWRN